MSFANSESLTSSFPIWILFLFLLWLLWLKLPKLCWIVVVRVGTLVPDFKGKAFNFSPLRIIFAVGLSYMVFTMLRYVPPMAAFWRVFFFYHKWMLNFFKGFFCICWDNHRIFIFQFVNVMCHIDWFVNIEESLHLSEKAHLVMMYDLFTMLLDSVC